ncbi:helix-turn-helix domain-containing protein [Acetobacter cibinongensis]|uniref:Transposase n=1 Tax=Acetobacter cibinongensis TaxID=146475 RepID=A0A1Z5YW31_9PROT|nr:helix-turn-helix domain-containing protein [Acetobacter cibinongensis]OUJ03189.1 hypothetical protein HK14_03225 [Acetobacter cibinongensis]
MGKVVPFTLSEEACIVAMRAQGVPFHVIARKFGRSEGGIWLVCLRNVRKMTEGEEEAESCGSDFMGLRECLPVGHPVVMRGLWKGMEQWRRQ